MCNKEVHLLVIRISVQSFRTSVKVHGAYSTARQLLNEIVNSRIISSVPLKYLKKIITIMVISSRKKQVESCFGFDFLLFYRKMLISTVWIKFF